MCDIFLRRGIAVPLAPALKRLRTGPFSTTALFTVSVSAARLLLFSALAIALLSVLTIRRADLRGISVRYSTASGHAALDRAGDLAHLLGRHAGVAGEGLTSMVRVSLDFLAGHSAVRLEDAGGANSPSLWPTMFSVT
jgi:hypothetical protein